MTSGSRQTALPISEIVDAAAALMREVGVAGLSARVVAQRAGLSPSAVNYHLGGRDGLLRALCARIREDFDRWTQDRLASIAAWPSDMLSPSSVVAGCVFDLARQPWAFALLEFRDMIRRGEIALVEAEESPWLALENFWIGVLHGFVLDEARQSMWRIFAAGALSLSLVDSDPVIHFAWLTEAARRLQSRADGVRPEQPPESHEPAQVSEPAPQPEGKRRIVEAAIRLIGEDGVDALTHRRVAIASGLSLASTTFFFKDKTEIVIAAFRELHRQSIARMTDARPSLATRLSQVMLREDGEPRTDVAAMNALYIAASHNDTLKPFALDLRRVRGTGSRRWLPARGAKNIDRLDGFIWSLLVGGLYVTSLPLPRQDRARFVDETSDELFELLYAHR
jgi:AcrR family transcriptional regulator